MLAHDGGIITSKTLWLGGGTRRGDGRLARQESPAAVGAAAIVRLVRAGVNGEDKGVYYPLDKAADWPLQFACDLG